ncbi:AraC family transcriptional regulator [Pendulispora albinea]|uniref:AraC family transcriptional regulator n=1 Tax=Pendulispora albinea TaxID=2741071 RepID=A0ABZ2M6R8_9BACT
MRIEGDAEGIERAEAYFPGQGFSPHRHDTYAIGITRKGVQTFRYRGVQWHCVPGQCHILYPDETHDGNPATDEGFGYTILHIEPRLVQEALEGKPLPRVRSPVVDARALPESFSSEIWDLDTELDDVSRTEMAVAVAHGLMAASSPAALCLTSRRAPLDFVALSRVREAIAACPAERHAMRELERIAGLDRWTIARQFRALFGTSPSRFRTLRRLDRVRRLLEGGLSLADASIEAGFADQSHMSRCFKSAYGLTPARWVAARELQ